MKKEYLKNKFLEMLMLFISYVAFECFFILATNKLIAEDIEIFFQFIPHILSFSIYYAFYSILKHVTKRPFLSGMINLVFLYILGIISIVKISYLGTPILISDFNFLKSFSEIPKMVSFSDICTIIGFSNFLLFTIIFAISIRVIFLASKNTNKHSYKKILLDILLLILIFNPTTFSFIVKPNEQSNSIIGFYITKGFYSGMYGEYLNEKIKKPEFYNEEEIKNTLNNSTETKINTWGTPNVVFVLSEAFWDINNIKEISFSEDIMADYNYVKEKSKTFNMISPTYAGMTTNVEYELLTGNSMRYFNNNYIPFNSLYTTADTKNLTSIVKFFNKANYDTKVYSPFDNGKVYNVKTVYDYLGFKNIFLKKDLINETNQKGNAVSDSFMSELIINEINNNENKIFLFVKTAQNHMPYKNDKYSNLETKAKKSSLSTEETFRSEIYAQGIKDAGSSLKYLYNSIQNIEEPTIVVYFGDHLPSLTTANGIDILSKLEHFNTQNEKQNLFNKYNTQTLIFSNFDIMHEEYNTFSFDALSAYIMKHLDIETNNYYNWLYNNLENYKVGNKYISSSTSGELTEISDFSTEDLKFYKLKEKIQYYNLKEE